MAEPPPRRPVPAAASVEYPGEDGLPMPTNLDHYAWLMVCYRILTYHFRGCRDLLIACDMLVYYKRGEDKIALAPDVFVSFGVPPGQRASYSVRREGKPPDVVLEFASPSTVRNDAGEKKEKYRQLGVREYWLVDPVGGYHDPQVQGFQLVDALYEQLPSEEGSEGMVAVWSPLLQLELRFADGQLRFWDREKALYVELPEEERDRLRLRERRGRLEERRGRLEERRGRQRAERGRQRAERGRLEAERGRLKERRGRLEAEQGRQRVEREFEAEKRARKALEERIAKFEAESRSTRDPT